MAFSSDEVGARRSGTRSEDERGEEDWAKPAKQQRDLKKRALVFGLGALSWVATYVGMLELIEANMGDLPLIHKAIIGFSVAMLMTMIIWLLDQMFQPIGLFTKFLYGCGYVFLTVISVGFGFGFYWKVLESRSESSRSAESAISQVQGSLHAASTRLEQLQSTLVQLTAVSNQKAEVERTSGTSCPNSRPGDGPRRKLREDDAARFSFASDFVKGRVEAVKGDMAGLDLDFAKVSKDDKSTIDARSGTRNEFMKGLSRKLDMTVTGFNAFRTDPQLKQIRSDLAERAEKVTFVDTRGGSYSCPDAQLQTALRGVVRAIEQLPEMEKPKIAAVEGSEATIEAFRRLTATFYGLLSFKMPPSADELRQLQQKAIQSVESGAAARAAAAAPAGEVVGLSKRDYVPLAIAIFVDICLLLVSMGRSTNRLQGLVPKMQAAEQGPVYQILSKFSEIHKDKETREKFEIFRHVVFDFNGDYYVAVPLNAPVRANPEQRLDLQLEAHLLSNLFSSFEKERIFSRVYSPFLTTKSIQKKLWRQGSKFAGSEAFRIYRFRDGAWSEIILGAVMGAARRVDAEKRRRGRERGPDLPFPADQASPAAVAREDDSFAETAGHRPAPELRTATTATAGSYSRNGYYSGGTTGERRMASARPLDLATRTAPTRSARRSTVDPATIAAQFGPYATSIASGATGRHTDTPPPPSANYREMAQALDAVQTAQQRVGEADVSVNAANNNTAPRAGGIRPTRPAPGHEDPSHDSSARDVPDQQPTAPPPLPAAADNVIMMPRVLGNQRLTEDIPQDSGTHQPASQAPLQPVPPTELADVTLRRETVTFSVPVSEARLPTSLAELLSQAVVTGQVARRIEEPQMSQAAITTLPDITVTPGQSIEKNEKNPGEPNREPDRDMIVISPKDSA